MKNTQQNNEKEIINERNLAKQIIWEKQIEAIARQKLMDIGVKIHILGFKYLKTGIVIVLDEERKNGGDLKMLDLYSQIAKKHNTTELKVERAIRHVHNVIDFQKYFNVPYKISNAALLSLLADEVKANFDSINNSNTYSCTP